MNATIVAQIINFLIIIAIFIVIPILIKRLFSNIEKINTELIEIRKILEKNLNK